MTRTYVSAYFNPVGFTRYKGVLILTNAGASRFNLNFVAEPTTDAVLEFLDVGADAWRDNWTVNLGEILPAVSSLALGKDGSGLRYGAVASQTFAAAYFVDLSGLDESPVDPSKLRLLRTIELSPGGATNTGTGYQPGLALSPDGTLVYVPSFNAATLHVLSLPGDIELGDVAVDLIYRTRRGRPNRTGQQTVRAMQAQSIGKTSRGITATIRYAPKEDNDGKWSVGSAHATNSTFSVNQQFLCLSNTPTREASRVNSRIAPKSPRKNVSF